MKLKKKQKQNLLQSSHPTIVRLNVKNFHETIVIGQLKIHKYSYCFQGDYIWIEPSTGKEFDVAIGARVITAEGRRIQVRDDDSQEQWLAPERRIKAMHASSVQGVEDMISLGDLHEAGILRNLLIRYIDNLIYVSPVEPQT